MESRTLEDDFEKFRELFYQYINSRGEKIREELEGYTKNRDLICLDLEDLLHYEPSGAAMVNIFQQYAASVDPIIAESYYKFATEKCGEDIKQEIIETGVTPKTLEYTISANVTQTAFRELRSDSIGGLVSVRAQVTRTSEVRPELVEGTFICKECGTKERGVEQQYRYTQPVRCSNKTCSNTKNWELSIPESSFTDWQKLTVQETPEELPSGCLPIRMDVILRGRHADKVKAGDKCIITGILLAVPDGRALKMPGTVTQTTMDTVRSDQDAGAAVAAGRANAGRGGGGGGGAAQPGQYQQQGVAGLSEAGGRLLSYSRCIVALRVDPALIQSSDHELEDPFKLQDTYDEARGETVTELKLTEKAEELVLMAQHGIPRLGDRISPAHMLRKLSRSIAPSVFGHDTVKMGLLLALVGGVPKMTSGGNSVALRGDINVLIVGDPSSAKSQLLRSLNTLCTNAVYTTGQSSSAAGLTAAVVKEAETGEFTVEPGAMILADHGVCIIDEFEKMNENDMVAIHEGMEQQTITIAKAGINTQFNARCAVVAAANPNYGRYDNTKSVQQNISLSPAILSRFDLFFVIVDKQNDVVDRRLAEFVLRNKAMPPKYLMDSSIFGAFEKCYPMQDISLSTAHMGNKSGITPATAGLTSNAATTTTTTTTSSSSSSSSSVTPSQTQTQTQSQTQSETLTSSESQYTPSTTTTSSSSSSTDTTASTDALSREQLMTYIQIARKINPKWTKGGAQAAEDYYVGGRQMDKVTQQSTFHGTTSGTSITQVTTRLTARQIESLIRVSEAICRLNIEEWVEKDHVDLAWKLIRSTEISTAQADLTLDPFYTRRPRHPPSAPGSGGEGGSEGGEGGGRQEKGLNNMSKTVRVVDLDDPDALTPPLGTIAFEVSKRAADVFLGILHDDDNDNDNNDDEEEKEGGKGKRRSARTKKESQTDVVVVDNERRIVLMPVERFDSLRRFILSIIDQKKHSIKDDNTKKGPSTSSSSSSSSSLSDDTLGLYQREILSDLSQPYLDENQEDQLHYIMSHPEYTALLLDDGDDDDDDDDDDNDNSPPKDYSLPDTHRSGDDDVSDESKSQAKKPAKETRASKAAKKAALRKQLQHRLSVLQHQSDSEGRLVIERMLRTSDCILTNELAPSGENFYDIDPPANAQTDERFISFLPDFSMGDVPLDISP